MLHEEGQSLSQFLFGDFQNLNVFIKNQIVQSVIGCFETLLIA